MSNNGNLDTKEEVGEGKRAKNAPKRRKFRSFSLGKSTSLKATIIKVVLIEINIFSNSEIFDFMIPYVLIFIAFWNILFEAC